MTDFENFLFDAVKNEDQSLDKEIVKKFAFIPQSQEEYPIDLENLIEWEVDAHRSASICRLEKSFSLNYDYIKTFDKSTGGRPKIQIMLTINCFKMMCAQSQNEKGKTILKYLLAVENIWKKFMEDKLKTKDDEIRKKDKQLFSIMRRIEAELGTKRAGFYIISDSQQDLCTNECGRPWQYKAGIDLVNVAKRLDQHKTDIPSVRVDYLVYMRELDCEILEKCILLKYEENRFPYVNHEWVFNIPVANMINAANHIIKYLNIKHIIEDKIVDVNKLSEYRLELQAEEEMDEHEVLEKKIEHVNERVTQQVRKQEEDQRIVQAKLDEIQRKMYELVTINNEMTSYDVKKLREALSYFDLNSAGPKLEIFKRLKEYVDAQRKALLLQVPDTREPEEDKEPEQLKQCSKCEKVLPVSRFYISSRSADGYRHRCKSCFDTRVMGTGKCAECETEISKRATHCKACNARRTSNRQCPNKPTREVFAEMIKVHTQKEIAKIVGVGKDTVMKWKKEWNL